MSLFQGQNVEPQVLALARRDVGQSQQFHVAKREGVEKLVASTTLPLPLVGPSPVPYPRSNREVPVACPCERITGQEKLHVYIH